jgi:hypothetical protein
MPKVAAITGLANGIAREEHQFGGTQILMPS